VHSGNHRATLTCGNGCPRAPSPVAGLAEVGDGDGVARVCGRHDGRGPRITLMFIDKAQRMCDSQRCAGRDRPILCGQPDVVLEPGRLRCSTSHHCTQSKDTKAGAGSPQATELNGSAATNFGARQPANRIQYADARHSTGAAPKSKNRYMWSAPGSDPVP